MRQKKSSEQEELYPLPPDFKLGKKTIGSESPVFLIAEAGSSHRGDIVRAREMIDAAAEGGADCIKFQWIIADEIIHPSAGSILLHGRRVPLWERFREVERPPDFYAELKEYSEKRKLVFLCSPFGKESARGLLDMGVDGIKIASPELNHFPLLEMLRSLPLIISTGVSTLADIEESLTFLKRGGDGTMVAILHCITAYPAPEREYNLNLLPLLSKIFGVHTGVSDHSRHPLKIPLLAAARGARIIEKHLTLSRKDGGLDDPIALEPEEFGEMCRSVRRIEFLDEKDALEEWEKLFGAGELAEILGNGRKDLAPSERPFYETTRRSLVALVDIEAGEPLTAQNAALLRSEQQRPPGIAPRYLKQVMGAVLCKGVRASEGIRWDHLLNRDT
jgi:N-acetylneuraminate synthase